MSCYRHGWSREVKPPWLEQVWAQCGVRGGGGGGVMYTCLDAGTVSVFVFC